MTALILPKAELSEQQQQEVRGILRHYPSEDEIKRHAIYGDGHLTIFWGAVAWT